VTLFLQIFSRRGCSRLEAAEGIVANWLFKSDPETYSFSDLERDGKTVWDGVSNNLALKHLRSARKGDRVLIYHTGDEKAVVGIAEVVSDSYPDPKQKDPRLAVVDLKASEKLARSVTLQVIKKEPALKDFELVRLPRLSVMPVSDTQWKAVLALAK
jgi:predicted RNA-binding protein with PUA-like domain